MAILHHAISPPNCLQVLKLSSSMVQVLLLLDNAFSQLLFSLKPPILCLCSLESLWSSQRPILSSAALNGTILPHNRPTFDTFDTPCKLVFEILDWTSVRVCPALRCLVRPRTMPVMDSTCLQTILTSGQLRSRSLRRASGSFLSWYSRCVPILCDFRAEPSVF